MDTWFAYVLRLSELIFQQKLEAYENACAALVLRAVGVQQAASSPDSVTGPDASAETTSNEAVGVVPPHCENESAPPTAAAAAAAAATVTPTTPSQPKAESVASTVHGATPSQSSVSGGEEATTATATAAASQPPAMDRRASPPPAASPVETVGALLDAMQLRKPLRSVLSRSQLIDDIQAEAAAVYQELDDVYTLRPEDGAALLWQPTAPSLPSTPSPPAAGHRDGSPLCEEHDQQFPAGGFPTLGGSMSSTATMPEQQLLYGELTSVGARQLQAISVASVCVSREHLQHSRSQNFGLGHSPPCLLPGSATNNSFGYGASSHGGSGSRHAGAGASLLMAGNVPRGAVVMCVDVGSGNGRLLFEWARLGAAACRRRPEAARRRSHAEEVPSFTATPPVAPHASAGGAAARRGSLLAATTAPLGVPAGHVVWRGWVGVGLELVPSRMRVARRALVPHYLNFKPALLVPAAVSGGVGSGGSVGGGRRPGAIPVLDPVAPEAIAVSASTGSFSSPTSVTSTAITRTAPTSSLCSPTTASPARAALDRVPQPTARVLLYEGDALAPGVLSNTTLCRFPRPALLGDTLTLLRGGALLKAAKAQDLVNGLGGDHMGSLGAAGGYASAMSAPLTGTASTCPYPTSSVVAAGAALNNAYLNSAVAGAYGRKGPPSFMDSSLCSVNSTASSLTSTRGGSSAKHNYYRLCRVEGGPSLTGREDPHLVVFCCGLGFDEPQVWRLCQRLEEMLLNRPPATTSPTGGPPSMGGLAASRNLSEDECGLRLGSTLNASEDADAASPVMGNPSSASSDIGEALEEMTREFATQVSTPTVAEPLGAGATGAPRDVPSYRHWESVTCVLLLRPMDVLAPNFPLFRYATRLYNTQEQPVAAEDTALLLATGNRADGTAARYVMRDPPPSDSQHDAAIAGTISESDVWTTTLETTWMSAAPAWVVRFRF